MPFGSLHSPEDRRPAPALDPASVRVAQVSAYPRDHVGGSEFYAHQLAVRLAKRGYRMSVITSNLRRWRSAHESWNGVDVQRCAAPFVLAGVNPATFAFPALLHSEADILHVHTHYFLTSVQAALVANRRRKLLLHLHGFDLAAMTGAPALMRLHRLREELYDRTVTPWILRQAAAVASVSRRDLAVLRDQYDVPPEDLHWIPNAVDPELFRRPRATDGGCPTLTFIGRLEPTKGADYLPAIVRKLAQGGPRFRLDIVGDGSLRPALESSLRRFNGNARFLGSVDHRLIPEILARSSILLSPSRVEGVPTVALEALAAGVPVIAADVGGTREVVQDGRTGYVCTPGDVGGFAGRTRYLLENEDIASRLGRAGAEVVSKDYTWPIVLGRIEKVYAGLLAQ